MKKIYELIGNSRIGMHLIMPLNTIKKAVRPVLRSLRHNIAPMLVIQMAMASLVLAFYFIPAVRMKLEAFAVFKQNTGVIFSFFSTGILSGIVADLLQRTLTHAPALPGARWKYVTFNFLYWGIIGMVVDTFYMGLAVWIGEDVTFRTLLIKTLIDQLGYSTFFANPLNCTMLSWRDTGFSGSKLKRIMADRYFEKKLIPTTIANWAFWFPVLFVLYALPTSLQLPFGNLAAVFYTILINNVVGHNEAENQVVVKAE